MELLIYRLKSPEYAIEMPKSGPQDPNHEHNLGTVSNQREMKSVAANVVQQRKFQNERTSKVQKASVQYKGSDHF